MKTFKTITAIALTAPLTLGAASVYAQTPDRDRDQDQRQTQQPANERRSAEEAQRQQQTQRQHDAQRQGMTGQADAKSGKAHHAGGHTQLTRAPDNTFHADWLMGQDIKAQTGDDTIGSIRDVLIDEDGKVVAVIVGVGGMLGIGERDVAIPWDSIQHTRDQDGESRFTTSMTQASLENVPEYDRDASSTSDPYATGTRDRDAAGTRRDATGTRERDTTTPRN